MSARITSSSARISASDVSISLGSAMITMPTGSSLEIVWSRSTVNWASAPRLRAGDLGLAHLDLADERGRDDRILPEQRRGDDRPAKDKRRQHLNAKFAPPLRGRGRD